MERRWAWDGPKGVPARESRTGMGLVSPAAACKKKIFLTPAEQGLGTSNLVH
jgi:hypothetical protein